MQNFATLIATRIARLGRRSLLLTAALVTVGLTTAMAPPSAGAQTVPSHVSGGSTCYSDRSILTLSPKQMVSWTGTTQVESVYWRADLYRWNGSAWLKYDTSAAWQSGTANGWGLVMPPYSNTYWHAGTQETIGVGWGTGHTSWSLRSGYYRVADVYKWVGPGFFTPDSPGVAVYTQWTTMNGATYCQIP